MGNIRCLCRLCVVALLFIAIETASLGAQTYAVLHTFSGGDDGGNPFTGGLLIDSAGNLYGTAEKGGLHANECLDQGCGVIFRLSPRGSDWIFSTLYSFRGGNDGSQPDQVLSFGLGGSLYGTTYFGGGQNDGTVFRLQPPITACTTPPCPWAETVLHRFQGPPADGAQPVGGHLVFDAAGNLYGTTFSGGPGGSPGIVYELERASGWAEKVIFIFPTGYNGLAPWGGVIFDNAGNLYGTTTAGGGSGFPGVIFQLTRSGSTWTEHVLHAFDFNAEGSHSQGAVIFDQDGNLYGTTSWFGPGGAGVVWQLRQMSGSWHSTVLHTFSGSFIDGPVSDLLMDTDGNLYGTTQGGGVHGWGTVFKLSRSGNSWDYRSLYDFTGGADGSRPAGQLAIDVAGNIYGTTFAGGSDFGYYGSGVVFKISTH